MTNKDDVSMEEVDQALKDSEKPEEPKADEPKDVVQVEPKKTINDYAMTERTAVMNPIEYAQIMLVSKNLIDGRAIPSGFQTKEQVFMAIMAGKEMGMSMIESLNSLYFVNGKINIYGAGLVSRFRKHGWTLAYSDESEKGCTATITKGEETYTQTFTFEEAEKSGYTKGNSGLKFGWKEGTNRILKLRYGALSKLAKTFVPEVFGSVTGVVEIEEDATDRQTTAEIIDSKPDDGTPATEEQKATLAGLMTKKANKIDFEIPADPTKAEAARLIGRLAAIK